MIVELAFTLLGLAIGLVVGVGREKEAELRGIAIGRRQRWSERHSRRHDGAA